MKSKASEQIFVKVMRNGFIPQLGICGPIPNPIKVTRSKAHEMIVAGVAVYQYFPETKYTEKLTLQNVFGDKNNKDVNPKNEKPEVKKPAEPIKPVELTGVAKETVNDIVNTIDEKKPEDNSASKNTVDETAKEKTESKPDTDNNPNKNNNNKKNKK